MTNAADDLDVPMSSESALMPWIHDGGTQARTFADVVRFCKVLAQSGLFVTKSKETGWKPVPLTWQQCFVRIQHGSEIGLSMMQSMWNIYDVHGHPHLQVETAWGLVLRSGELEDSGEEWFTGEDPNDEDARGCMFWAKPKGRRRIERRFTIGEAKDAGLVKDDSNWKKHSKRMVFQRAKGFVIKDAFPHIMHGLGCAADDEIREVRDVTPADRKPGRVVTQVADPVMSALPAGEQRIEFTMPARERERVEVRPGPGGPERKVEVVCPTPAAAASEAGSSPAPGTTIESEPAPEPEDAPAPDLAAGSDSSSASGAASEVEGGEAAPDAPPFDPERENCPECGQSPRELRAMGHAVVNGEECSLSSVMPRIDQLPVEPPKPTPIPRSLQQAITKRMGALGLVPTRVKAAHDELTARVSALLAEGAKDIAVAQAILNWRPKP